MQIILLPLRHEAGGLSKQKGSKWIKDVFIGRTRSFKLTLCLHSNAFVCSLFSIFVSVQIQQCLQGKRLIIPADKRL